MPAKSSGLHVYTGNACARAVAAIIASYDRASGLRPDCRSDATTRPEARGGTGVERQCVEIGFRLLQVRLARRALVIGRRDQGADREFGKRDRRDQRFVGEE